MIRLANTRHRALIGAIALLVVALVVAAGALLDRERAMQQLSKEQVYWSVAQAEIELYRFIAALEAYNRGDPGVGRDEMVQRFDIFWSRMTLFEGGDVAQRVLSFEGAPEAVADARAVMLAEEGAVMTVEADDDAEIMRLYRRFNEAGLALHRLAVAVNQAEVAMLAALREQLRTEVLALVAIVGGMLSGGAVLMFMVRRENLRNQELALLNRQFVAASDASVSALMLCQRQGDRLIVVYTNDRFRELAGGGGLEGSEPAILLKRRLNPSFAASFDEALATGEPTTSRELPLERNGGRRWLRQYLTPMAGENERVDAVLVKIDDVTQEVVSLREIEGARDEAMRANAAKSRFVAVMSHEIRTPMNGVLGALGLIAQRNRDGALNDLIGTARASGEALLAILNDVLDITRMEAGQLRLDAAPVDLAGLVRSVAQAWEPLAAERGVALNWQIAPEVPCYVAADGARLRQMLVNLVANAVKFTDHGTIAVDVSLSDATATPAMIRFQVSDSGPGIDPKDFRRLFQEYDQIGQHGRGGTGLGLAIVRRLAETMGGSVSVESEPGKGSVFHFDLPLPQAEAPVARAVEDDFVLDGLDVLVAEDNATNRVIVSEILKDLGCRVRLAANGEEAVAMASERVPEIVLMDIAMPVMDGHEALAYLRAGPAALAGLPVVALTAYAMSDEVAGFLAEGFDAALPKPVVREALADILQRLTGRTSEPATGRDKAATVGPREHPAVDAAVLLALLASLGEETGQQLVESFDADVAAALERIAGARDRGDIAALERDSHILAGLSATYGLLPLAETARLLNRACRAGDRETALAEAGRMAACGAEGLAAFRGLTAGPGFATLPSAASA